MLRDVEFTKSRELTMRKKLWSPNELALATCLGFTHKEEEAVIKINLNLATKVSVMEFLKEAFPRIMNHPSEDDFRRKLLKAIDTRYKEMWADFEEKGLNTLGYQDKLYAHQKEGLFNVRNRKCNFISYEQGLGKTLIAGSISKMLKVRRTLIICPASLKHNWLKEMCGPISQFNEMYISILDANQRKSIIAFQERFVIVNFESLGKHMKHILSSDIGHIIIDEAVKIKSTSTRYFKMVHHIVESYPNAKVTLLSGSPIRNRVSDLFAYLKLVNHPLGQSYAHFLREYAISTKGRGSSLKITGAKNTEVLWRQLSNFMLRKRKDECLDLPPKIYSKLYFELNEYKDEYERAVREMIEETGKKVSNSSVHQINKITSKAKLPGVIEMAEGIIDQGEKVVIFSGYTDTVESLQAHFGKKAVLVNGAVNSSDRAKRVERFMKDDTCMVFVANTISGGMGLTLTSACNMIFCDFPFSPADLVQAEDRLHRISQHRSVNIYYAICSDSIDENLYRLIANKAHDASKIIDNKSIDMEYSNLAEVLVSELKEKYGHNKEVLESK